MLFRLRPQDLSDNTREAAGWFAAVILFLLLCGALYHGLRRASCHDAVADGCLFDQRGPVWIVPGPVGR